jgi:hypothetical protein
MTVTAATRGSVARRAKGEEVGHTETAESGRSENPSLENPAPSQRSFLHWKVASIPSPG